MRKQEITSFAKLIGQNLLDQGATIIDCFQSTVIPKRGTVWLLETKKFSLETICGELHLIVYDGWIACRFQDIDRAKHELPTDLHAALNPYSGKWNHHYLDGWNLRDAVQDFHDMISRILPRPSITGNEATMSIETGGAA
jgi:hypothetical protein